MAFSSRTALAGLVLAGGLAACSDDAQPGAAAGGAGGGAGAAGAPIGSAGALQTGGVSAAGGVGGAAGSVATSGGASPGGAGSGAGGAPAQGGAPAGGGTGSASGGASSGGAGGPGGAPSDAGTSCPYQGQVTYTLARAVNPSAAEQAAYDRITEAMDRALEFYNCYTDITKALNVQYNPSVPTADGNPNGSLRFGSEASMNFVTAMHEVSHTVGVGAAEFDALVVNGVFTGPIATAELRDITGDPAAQVHGDTQHFWPYGLNYTTEFTSDRDGIDHCRMVVAIRKDMGWQ